MELGFDGKVALVAAGSRGIGRATALQLSREGAAVAICARGEDDLTKTVEDCQGPAIGVQADVSERDDVERFVQDALDAFERIDVLVNNAGGPPRGGFEDVDSEAFRDALDLNLMSTISLTKECLPHLKEGDWGRIINITSISAKEPLEDLVLSNTARTGVLGAAKTLSREVAEENVTVNSVLPGLTGTDRLQNLIEGQASEAEISYEEAKAESESGIPMGRWGEPQELADVITFLASERASYVTGTALQVDGGLVSGLL
jgi:3-oxoacyl-[acyl-carrier protein] reductase